MRDRQVRLLSLIEAAGENRFIPEMQLMRGRREGYDDLSEQTYTSSGLDK